MRTLLFPGRHLANTRYQEGLLLQVLDAPLAELPFEGEAPEGERIGRVIFAVTSANQSHSRYNPVPFHARAVGVDRFARSLREALGVECRIVGIPHYRPSDRFAHNLVTEIEDSSEGLLRLSPENTVVLCSTPELMAQFRLLGFPLLPAEEAEETTPLRPLDLIKRLAELGEDWQGDGLIRRHLSPATYSLWTDYPELPTRIVRLYRDPLLNDEGSLTETRDYQTYAWGMSNPAIIELKYKDIAMAITEGRIVDEGCADGALLIPIARDHPDADLIGIDIAAEFLALCAERQRRGDFADSYVHFHQRNLLDESFEPGSIDVTICNSTTHELWSYGEGAKTLRGYLRHKHRQSARGGRLIVRDVVGPRDGEREVWLWCNSEDGSNEEPLKDFAEEAAFREYLVGLSTAARFLRFCQDFLAEERSPELAEVWPGLKPVEFREEERDGRSYVVLSLRNAAEFISRKDYTDNWHSEMHEQFCFWDFEAWKRELPAAGWTVIETPSEPEAGSRVYLNPWIVENRYLGKVELFSEHGGALVPEPYPPTNVVMVAERR